MPNGTSANFERIATKLLAPVENVLSPTTARGYRDKLNLKIFPAKGDHPANEITTYDLDPLHRGLVNRLGLSTTTVRQTNAIIRRALRLMRSKRTVAGRLGHTNPATTLPVYTQFVEASNQDVAAVKGNLRRGQSHRPKMAPRPDEVYQKQAGRPGVALTSV